MAIIPEFNAPLANQVVRPNETGESAIQRAAVMGERRASVAGDLIARAGQEKGQAIAGLGKLAEQGINDYGEHEFLMDASDQGPKLAGITNTWQNDSTAAWQKLDPKDPQAFQNYHDQQMDAYRQQFMQGVRTTKGQARADELFNQFAAHTQNQTTAAYSEIAGAKTHADAVNTLHALTQAADSNLSNLQSVHDQWDHQMAIYSNAKGVDARQIADLTNLTQQGHEHIDTSALKSAVDAPHSNLDAIQKMLDSGGFKYANKGEVEGYIRQAKRMNDAEARAARSEARENLRDYQDKNMAKALTANMSDTGQLNASAIPDIKARISKGEIRPEQGMMVIEGISRVHEAADREATLAKHDDATVLDLSKGVTLPSTDPNYRSPAQVYEASLIGRITGPEARDILNIQNAVATDPLVARGMERINSDKVIEYGYDQAAATLKGLAGAKAVNPTDLGGVNLAVQNKISQFKQDTLRILQQAVMQHQDLNPLINDPTSKTYLFSPERINMYKATDDELAHQLVTSAAAAAAAKNSTEGKPKEDLGSILSKALNFAPKPAEQKPVDRRPEG